MEPAYAVLFWERTAIVIRPALLLLVAAATIAAGPHDSCPSTSARATGARSESMIVQRVDRAHSTIFGETTDTHEELGVRVCDSTLINEGTGELRTIQDGDLVSAVELQYGDRYYAMKVGINLYTAHVTIEGASRNRLQLSMVDTRRERRLAVLYPSYLGALPTLGILNEDTQIEESGRLLDAGQSIVGRRAWIFGYKSPNSNVVRIFRVRLIPERYYTRVGAI